MIGDEVIIKEKYFTAVPKVLERIGPINKRIVIAIAGESGSGKTTLARAFQEVLEQQNIKCCLLHMDDYFTKPPHDNHQNRLEDVKNIGPHEVQLNLMDDHIQAFLTGETDIEKPLVHYKENTILKEQLDLRNISVLLVEGTYCLSLQNPNFRIFLNRTFEDTRENRIKRARDPIIPFNERVLLIEHQIISKHKMLADIVLNEQFQIL